MTRYRRREGNADDARKAVGVAAGAGLGVAAVLFYLAWNWLRREPVGPGSAPRDPVAGGRPSRARESDPS